MQERTKRRWKKTLIALAATYLLFGVLIYFGQELLLFHPKALPANHRLQFAEPFEEVSHRYQDHVISVVKFKSQEKRKGLVLFFHGNMENVEHYGQYPGFFLKNHYDIWMIDYPGFGKSTGTRTEATIQSDALYFYDQALKETAADSIVLYGKSIGTGVAAYVATQRSAQQLILETPYYSIQALAQRFFPVYPTSILLRYQFPVHTYLKQLSLPVRLFHGTKDEVIPYWQSQRLAAENPAIRLFTLPQGRHNNLATFPVFHQKLDSLLNPE